MFCFSIHDLGQFCDDHPDSTSMAATTFCMLASSLILITAANLNYENESAMNAAMWSLMPIVGALLASCMAFLLNRISENRRAVIGRVIGACVTGVGLPRIMTYIHPTLKTMSLDPVLLILCGFCCGLLGYAAAAHMVSRMFRVAPGFVDQGLKKAAEKIGVKDE